MTSSQRAGANAGAAGSVEGAVGVAHRESTDGTTVARFPEQGRRRGSQGVGMRIRYGVTALVLIGALGVAGCSGESSKDASSSAAQARDEAGSGGAAARKKVDGVRSGGSAAVEPAPGGRASGAHIVRTASLEVRVRSVPRTVAETRSLVTAVEGHVADESTRLVGGGRMESIMELRVPQRRYDTTLTALARSGKLLNRSSTAEDVTERVVDVRSRISSQRASVARVRELMDRAGKLSDVVTLEGELSRRQAELEALLAKRESLEGRAELATITLSLTEQKRRDDSGKRGGDEDGPGFVSAFGGGVGALVATVRWAGVVIGAVLPFAVVLGAGFAVWRWSVRARSARSAGRTGNSDRTGDSGGTQGSGGTGDSGGR
ncbi:DUF4349 domain-containing protein [Streptomyces sp. NPDC000594]|uniref:DUF4349 domain-containing protein n=1 Tax=Streptomyces sp. NPDC000594 TaxID=3154261 RepID=UPI003328552F